jgi:CelD/BcsL family acetyltransferase involved in cellulose biosynthesis
MQLQVIQTLEEFDNLAGEWNSLLDCSASHVPFLRHEYLAAWWRTLGGGEWAHGDLYVVTARREDGSLGAVAPLFFTENREGEPALMLLGSIEISDYLDVIICTDDTPDFVQALFEHLKTPLAPPWKVLDFYNIPEGSPTLQVLQSAAAHCGWTYSQERLQHCPYIPLPGDWEIYLAGIDKKQRHEIRRKMRRAESYEAPVRWYFADGGARLDEQIESFFYLMEQDPDKKAFLTPAMRSQMQAAIHAACEGGWLQLAFLDVGDEKAAAYLNFDYGNHIWVYNSGLDFKHSAVSPGWVLLGYLLQWANENKRGAFDFMRGDEEYKYRFGAVDRFIVRASIRRS